MQDQRHCHFRHLLRVLRPDAVVTIDAYFDESGTHDGSPVVCVAGYLFESEQVIHFDKEWDTVLKGFGLTHYHAVDAAHGTGEFARLSGAERIDLAKSLIGIIKRRVRVGISVSVSDTNFGQIEGPVWRRGGPYTLCAAQVLMFVTSWADKQNFNGKISYFFESGHHHASLTNDVIDQLREPAIGASALRYHSHTFAPKKEVLALQSADILAYEWTKELKRINGAEPSKRPMRRALESLLDVPHYQQHFGAVHLNDFFTRGFQSILEHAQEFHEVD